MSELVYGRHPVIHLLTAARRRVFKLFLLKGADEKELVELAKRHKIPIQYQDSHYFKKLDLGPSSQMIVAEVERYPYVAFEDLLEEKTILILDEIQDPQNLGALCRTALIFGVKGVVIPETHAASVGSGACQASVGAVEYLKIARVSSIAHHLDLLKKNGFWVYGTDASAEKSVHEETYPEKVALVIGNEEKGLRRLVRERCDIAIKIPMVDSRIDSLNASVSGAICLYEISRQRMNR